MGAQSNGDKSTETMFIRPILFAATCLLTWSQVPGAAGSPRHHPRMGPKPPNGKLLWPCFPPKLHDVGRKCHEELRNRPHGSGSSPDCQEGVAYCRRFDRQKDFADCALMELDVIDEASGQIDFAQFKEAAIRSCTLSDDLKDAALATFDQCTTAAVPSPYFSLHFQRQNVPELMRNVLSELESHMQIGYLTPSQSMVIIDCHQISMIHNGCVPSSQEQIQQLEASFQ